MKKLFLFTANFPYGKIESFLEDEIHYLAAEFDSVEIIPLRYNGSIKRPFPNNCVVWEPIIKSRKQQYVKGLFCLKTIPLFCKDFFRYKVFLSPTRFKTWLIGLTLANCLMKSKRIKALFSKIDKDDVCYFYWGKGANMLSCFYKGRAHFVSRFHGEWDLWEESSGGFAPLREQIADSLDAAVFISEKGRRYFEKRYSGCKTCFFPLGSSDMGYAQHERGDLLLVVSCSTVYPLKRVPLIFEAVKRIRDISVSWTHIGSGEDFELLLNQVKSYCPSNVNVSLLGAMSHDDVMKYYQEHQFDVFVNVSTNEGVPVSIMEALSFDIPVVATDVGGNSEIVTEQSGVLISANPNADEVASAIIEAYNKKCSPRAFWETHYSAEVNYLAFSNFLKSL